MIISAKMFIYECICKENASECQSDSIKKISKNQKTRGQILQAKERG